MSDIEIRNYERALRLRGWFRFVMLVDHKVPQSGAERATLAQWCGDPGYTNLMRRHVWAVPVYTLEDVANQSKVLAMESIFDLVERRRISERDDHTRCCELEEGWTDTTFEQPGTLRRLYRDLSVRLESALAERSSS